jgi:predicted ATPase/signal transduction histidine kinase
VVDLSNYALSPLRTGALTLYRGSGNRVASALFVTAENNSLVCLKRLEHEYELRGELDAAWAARPVALSRYNARPTLVLEDPGGDPLDRLLGGPLDVSEFLRITIPLAGALRRVHERGLVHKDIKPGNILLDVVSGGVWLTGFGIASRLPRERQNAEAPEVIAGTLAYMAPEQTGRMNRSIDSRSDLYSLGITFYEMLTGTLPFSAADPLEWVHCHIARQPTPPDERVIAVPAQLSAIVMKLLAKIAEERYQTAAGVEADLRRCQTEWTALRRITLFPLGTQDVPDRLLIPEKLYGREREIDALLASFERVVANGTPELVLVSGYSGIGKSSVVNELHKVLVPPHGLFASGKFDQYKRDIPYATLAQAFQGLVRPLLGQSKAELGQWRDALREALGQNGQLMVNLVPELELVIGKQPSVPDLPPQSAQNRFQMVVRRFIGVFARPEHPLALFLDDLQWLDAAMLDLLEDLLPRPDVQHLMLIGAYRDNEVDSAHPLMRKLEAIRRAGATVQEILLAPMTGEDLGRLLVDSLHCEPERVASLAQLIHEKTGGNPFFAVQFISSLAEEALLTFDHSNARWSWDLNRIHAKSYSDNVLDLMVRKLNRLPVETQKALQQLACLGSSAEFALLMMVYEHSQEEMHGDLREAVRTGLVLVTERAYKFVHDRVQEAVYSYIPEGERSAAHLRIGRLLVLRTAPEEIEDEIFEIVSQLNRGSRLITSTEERERVAELNLIAGKRAKAAIAYASALTYLAAGRAVLKKDSWERQYRLTFDLELNRAECEFLAGEVTAAEERLAVLSLRAANLADRAAVIGIQVSLHTHLGKIDSTIETCLGDLRLLGVMWSLHPTDEEVREEYERMRQRIGGRAIETFIDLPLMVDPEWRTVMNVMTALSLPAGIFDKNLMDLVVLRMANLSLEHGNTDASCIAYVHLGLFLGPRFGDYRTGYQFGQLSVDMVEKLGLERFKTRVYASFGAVVPWMRHIRESYAFARRACEAGLEGGDLTWSSYAWRTRVTSLLDCGAPLGEVQIEAENGLAFARKAQFHLAIELITAPLRLIRVLRGLTPGFGTFSDDEFDEPHYEQHLEENPLLAHATFRYWVRKLQARFYTEDYASALAASAKAQSLAGATPHVRFENAEYHFFAALSHAASCTSSSVDDKSEHLMAIVAHHRQLTLWAEDCPANFLNRAALVGAEIARLEGRELDAERLYEDAIRSAHEHGFIQNEGIAYELAARFYASRHFDITANAYLQNARLCYRRWGAEGKVRQLDQLYPRLSEDSIPSALIGTIGAPIEQLDIATVVKASQALSGEIVLGKLIETLMRIVVEHAGADRGLLILFPSDEPRIEAEATTHQGSVEITLRQAAVTPSELPESVLYTAVRTRESVILDDASSQNPFSRDGYIRQTHARSVLCLPLVKQAKLVGALYLENKLTPHAFTSGRIAVLKLLASQAAISLENARLYADLRLENSERKRAEEGLRRSESYLAEAQRLSQTGSCGWSPASGKVYWSEETYRIFEFDRATTPTVQLIMGQRVHPEDVASVWQVVERASHEGRDFAHQYRLRMPDGRVKYLHVVAHAIRNEPGDVDFVGAVMDVTAIRMAEVELHKTQTELAHVMRMTSLGELTASIAHEVNQPLGAVITNAEACLWWLDRENPNLDEAHAALERIMRDGSRAGEVIRRVRMLAKKTDPQMVPLNVNDVVSEGTAFLQHEFLGYGVSLRMELAPALPVILADRVQLQQVILNLTLNGIEAMQPIEDRPRELVIRSEQDEAQQVRVTVTDCGVGFSAEDTDRLFNAFYTTKPAGMGMGLSICRSIIEAHGGRIWAAPNVPRGATIQFTLPLHQMDAL